MELSLETSEADIRGDLVQLQTDLCQLIQLTEGASQLTETVSC